MIKVNDILEVIMSIELLNVPYYLKCIDINDYKKEYNIEYYLNNKFIKNISMETEPGYWDNIKDYIEENFINDIENIAEYEIIETDSKIYEYQTAKIKVKSLK